MPKRYTTEFKLKVVKEYLKGDLGFRRFSRRNNLSNKTVQTWVRRYKQSGLDGLKSSSGTVYPLTFKLEVISYLKKHQLTVHEAAKVFNITHPFTITRWIKNHDKYGILGLKYKPRGRPHNPMNNSGSDNYSDIQKPLNETERQELDRLRVEMRKVEVRRVYEKKLEALTQEQKTKRKYR